MNNGIRFQRGEQVNVFSKNGQFIITGKIADTHTNQCTYQQEYNIDYNKNGKVWTMICVPEERIQEVPSLPVSISVNVWGKQSPATLTTWTEIKKLGFEVRDRSFGTLNDGRQALFFNGAKLFPKEGNFYPNQQKDEWLVTTETLEDIEKQN